MCLRTLFVFAIGLSINTGCLRPSSIRGIPTDTTSPYVQSSISQSLTWMPVGTRGFGLGGAFAGENRLAASENRIYALTSYNFDLELYHWDGSDWAFVDSRASSNYIGSGLIALDADENPVVTYYDWDVPGIVVVRHDGTSWQSVGTPSYNYVPHYLEIDPATGYIYVATLENGNSDVYVLVYDGQDWDILGPKIAGPNAEPQALRIIDSVPYIAYAPGFNQPTRLAKFEGGSWQIVGSDPLTSYTRGISIFPTPGLAEPQVLATIDGPEHILLTLTNGTWESADFPLTNHIIEYGQVSTALDKDGTAYFLKNVTGNEGNSPIIVRLRDSKVESLNDIGGTLTLEDADITFFDGKLWLIGGDLRNGNKASVFILEQGAAAQNLAWKDSQPQSSTSSTATWVTSDGGAIAQEIQLYEDEICSEEWGTPISLGANTQSYTLDRTGKAYVTFRITSTLSNGTRIPSICSEPSTLTNNWYVVGSPHGDSAGAGRPLLLKFDADGTTQRAMHGYGFEQGVRFYHKTNEMDLWVLHPFESTSGTPAISSTDIPYVAYMDSLNNNYLTVETWNETSWTPLGSPGFTSIIPGTIHVAIKSDGFPYVVFRNHLDLKQFQIWEWDGSAWEMLGNITSTNTLTIGGIAVNSEDHLAVAFTDAAQGTKVRVKYYNGTALSDLGAATGISAGAANMPVPAFDADDVPYVAFRDSTQYASVLKYDSGWGLVGAAGFGFDTGQVSQLVFWQGLPTVFWRNATGTETQAYQFASGAWSPLANRIKDTTAYFLSAVNPLGDLMVSYQQKSSSRAMTRVLR